MNNRYSLPTKVSNRSRTSAPLLEHGLAKLCVLVQCGVPTAVCTSTQSLARPCSRSGALVRLRLETFVGREYRLFIPLLVQQMYDHIDAHGLLTLMVC